MTDHQEDLDPQDEQVRRLLADARYGEPVPVDVAARLDRVLAQLAAGDDDTPATATELAGRRRRRAKVLLVAAAAVTAAGIGLGQVVPGSAGSDDASESAAGTSPAAGSRQAASEGPAEDRSGGAERRSDLSDGTTEPRPSDEQGSAAADGLEADSSALLTTSLAPPAVLRADRFTAGVVRVRHRVEQRGALRRAGKELAYVECPPADWGPGLVVPVRYERRPHVLAFRDPTGDIQVVDLLQCGTGDILRSTTIPAD